MKWSKRILELAKRSARQQHRAGNVRLQYVFPSSGFLSRSSELVSGNASLVGNYQCRYSVTPVPDLYKTNFSASASSLGFRACPFFWKTPFISSFACWGSRYNSSRNTLFVNITTLGISRTSLLSYGSMTLTSVTFWLHWQVTTQSFSRKLY